MLVPFALGALALALGTPAAPDPAANRLRALDAYVAMQRHLFDVGSGRYRERPTAAGPAHLWPVSQALQATVDVAGIAGPQTEVGRGASVRLPKVLARFGGRLGYRSGATRGAAVYYDDNVWVALGRLDWFEQSGDRASLADAERLFGLVLSAWDTDDTHPCPGGVFWTRDPDNRDRNTVSTAGGALLALRLYEHLDRPALLYWGRRMGEWVDRCLAAPNGLYWDHVGLNGRVEQAHWSYNQGLMIGVDDLLYRLAGDGAALDRARRLATLALDRFDETARDDEPPEFMAIFFRNVLLLSRDDPDPRYLTAAQAYADAVWSGNREPITGLFSFGGGPPRLLDQAAMAQLYARLATAGR